MALEISNALLDPNINILKLQNCTKCQGLCCTALEIKRSKYYKRQAKLDEKYGDLFDLND